MCTVFCKACLEPITEEAVVASWEGGNKFLLGLFRTDGTLWSMATLQR